jgi:hypothetical protein
MLQERDRFVKQVFRFDGEGGMAIIKSNIQKVGENLRNPTVSSERDVRVEVHMQLRAPPR